MKKLFTLSVGLSSILLAQNITSIQYNGLLHLSEDLASEVSDIHVGDAFDIMKIDESLKSFYAQGYFSDIVVSLTPEGGLVYNFKEKSVISKLQMNGYSSDEEQEGLFIAMGLRKGDLYDARKIEKAKKRLIKRIEAEGYYDTIVEVEVEPKEDSIALVFNVNKGEKIYIDKIDFAGAKKLNTDDIESALANKEGDFMGWFPGLNDGTAHLEQLKYDGMRAKDVYMQHGYLDATVSDPLMRVDEGSYKADISYQINEGEQYRVSRVSIVGDTDLLDLEEIKDNLQVMKGKTFNIAKARKDKAYIQEQIANQGYAYARVVEGFQQNKQDHTIALQYQVRKGKKVYINDVLISGNHTTKDRVIRRDVYLAPGDLFSMTELKESKNTLGRRGYFESVNIEQERVDDQHINLLVKVKETPTGSIQAGGGYGSYQGPMLSASISDRNFLGSGIKTGLSFDVSKLSKNYSLSFTNPRIWDSDYSFGANLYQNEFQYRTYDQKSIGAGVNLGKQLTHNLFGSLSYQYSKNKATAVDNSENILATQDYFSIFSPEDSNYAKSMFSMGLNYDNTDDFYTPREGIILGGTLGYAGVGGDQNFIEARGRFGLYYGLEDIIDYDLILRYKVRGTVLSDRGSIAIPERLYIGGIGSVRGYEPYSITPFSVDADGNRKLKGGTQSLVNSLEASIPLSKAARMRLSFFYDYGMIGENSFTDIQKEGYGVSLEWISPMGPINLVFGRARHPDALDRTSNFEFTMGQKF